LLGLMLGYATGAVVSILIYFSVPEQIQAYISLDVRQFRRRHRDGSWPFWRR
jgi:small basic protein